MNKLPITLALVFMLAPSVSAQLYYECADVDGDSSVNITDMIYEIEAFRGVLDLPAGRGDIDYRQGFNLGDFRYLIGWIFMGFPEPGCPPFPAYSIQTTDDTLYLPIVDVPTGDGTLALPIVFVNQYDVTDLLVPLSVSGMGTHVTFDSIHVHAMGPQAQITMHDAQDSSGVFLITAFNTALPPGRHLVATAHFTYAASPGGMLFLAHDSPNAWTFLNYVYGAFPVQSYDSLDVGVPVVAVSDVVSFPQMSVAPDTIEFTVTKGSPEPDPQYIYVSSDGEPFEWSFVKPFGLEADRTTGVSGDSVGIWPRPAQLSLGTHTRELEFYSTGAANSPQTATVLVHIVPDLPPFDANCDGVYNLADIIIQVNFLFRNGAEPCNPFIGP